MIMKKIITILAAVALSASLHAQDAATTAMSFAARPSDAKSLAMGGTTAFHSMAARVQDATKLDANVFYMPWKNAGGSSNGFGADVFARLGKSFGIGANFLMDNGKPVDNYTGIGSTSGKFTPKSMVVGGGISYKIIPAVSIGASVRYLSDKLTAKTAYSAIGADVMLSGKFSGFSYAAGVTNLGSKVKKSESTTFAIPAAATVAGRYNYTKEVHDIEASLQADWFFKGGFRAGAGAQYTFKDMVSARLGYSYGGKSPLPSFFSVGAGFKFKGITIDGAFLVGDVTGTFMAALGYRF